MEDLASLPARPSATPNATDPRSCRSGLGVAADDAEDDQGMGWSVLVEEVMPGGRGAEVGLQAGDVLIEFDGVPLAQPGPEDPDERLQRLLSRVEYGREIRLTLVRAGERSEVSFLPVAAR